MKKDFDDLPDKFKNQLMPDPITKCWLWIGKRNLDGYGIATITGVQGVHRCTYTILRGKIPLGMCIDHLCRNRACANPEHMEIVTIEENTIRGAVSRKLKQFNSYEYTKWRN